MVFFQLTSEEVACSLIDPFCPSINGPVFPGHNLYAPKINQNKTHSFNTLLSILVLFATLTLIWTNSCLHRLWITVKPRTRRRSWWPNRNQGDLFPLVKDVRVFKVNRCRTHKHAVGPLFVNSTLSVSISGPFSKICQTLFSKIRSLLLLAFGELKPYSSSVFKCVCSGQDAVVCVCLPKPFACTQEEISPSSFALIF